MTTPGMFKCPSCAAPLTPEADGDVKCPFCGSVVVVPPELRPQQPHQPRVIYSSFSTDQPQVFVGRDNLGQIDPRAKEVLEHLPEMLHNLEPMLEAQQGTGFIQQPVILPRRRNRGMGCFGFLIFIAMMSCIFVIVGAATSPALITKLVSNIPSLSSLQSGPFPDIATFTVTPNSVNTGDSVTLKWTATADSVKIDGDNINTISSLPASGQRTLIVLGSGTVKFKLTAVKFGIETSKTITVTVKSKR